MRGGLAQHDLLRVPGEGQGALACHPPTSVCRNEDGGSGVPGRDSHPPSLPQLSWPAGAQRWVPGSRVEVLLSGQPALPPPRGWGPVRPLYLQESRPPRQPREDRAGQEQIRGVTTGPLPGGVPGIPQDQEGRATAPCPQALSPGLCQLRPSPPVPSRPLPPHPQDSWVHPQAHLHLPQGGVPCGARCPAPTGPAQRETSIPPAGRQRAVCLGSGPLDPIQSKQWGPRSLPRFALPGTAGGSQPRQEAGRAEGLGGGVQLQGPSQHPVSL